MHFPLQEAIDKAFGKAFVEAIYMEPSESSVLTDEDSADEENIASVDNLFGRQLTSDAEVVLAHNNQITGSNYITQPSTRNIR